MRKSLLFLLPAFAVVWVFTGCEPTSTSAGSGDDNAGDTGNTGDTANGGSGETTVIEMVSGNRFEPREVTVAPGSTVRWISSHTMRHTATSDTGAFASDGDFPSGLAAGEQWEWTVPDTVEPGTVLYYHCRFHASPGGGSSFGIGMVGSLTVEGGA